MAPFSKESDMLTLDRHSASDAPDETRASPATWQAHRGSPSLTPRDRQLIDSLIQPNAATLRVDETAIDPSVRRWMPVVVPMLAVLISGCILAIWSIL
jgi:hypothetical protein